MHITNYNYQNGRNNCKSRSNNNSNMKNDMKYSRKSMDFGRRATSGSKHQLNPAVRPSFKID